MIVRKTARTALVAILGASASAMMLTGTAHADRRNPAPISYGGQTSTQTPVTAPQTARPAPQGDASTRIEFRYPGQGATVTQVPEAQKYAALPTQSVQPQPFRPDMQAPTNLFQKPVTMAPAKPIRISAEEAPAAKPIGRPLTLSRVRTDRAAPMSEEVGRAGVYTAGFDGRPTANGEIYDGTAMTAAHPNLPLPSLVQVTNQNNGKEIVVRVNDRGPFAGGRILDLSKRAASSLGFSEGQTADIRIRYLGPAPVMQALQSSAMPGVVEDTMPAFEPAPLVRTAEYPVTRRAVRTPITVAAPAQVMAATGNVFIQAGSFLDIGNAQRFTDALGRKLPVEIHEARVHNADYFRVMIGPFPSRQQAETYRAHLSDSGIAQGIIVVK